MDKITVHVDLRSKWATVRDQGGRSACLACATSDAHTHCHSLPHGLSAEFLFYQAGQYMPQQSVSSGLTFDAIDQALKTEGQPDESEWPYQPIQPVPWTPPKVTKRWYGALGGAGAVAADEIAKIVKSGSPAILGLRLSAQFLNLQRPFVIPAVGAGFGGHAVLAVGLGQHAVRGQLLLIRNSWGPTWGLQGCAWLERGYVDDKLIEYRTISPAGSK